MARIVTTVGMTHKPVIYWFNDAPPANDRASVLESFDRLRKRLDEAKPDSIIVIANDHVDNFFVENMPSFCIGMSNKAEGPFAIEQEHGIPRYEADVDEDLSRFLLREGIRNDMDFARTSEYRLDHAFVIPLSFISPRGDIPIVPVFTNTLVPPIPSIKRFHDLGRTIARAIESYKNNEARVAVIGSINLSVDVGGPRYGTRDAEFDDQAVDLMKGGSMEDISKRLTFERMFKAGNASSEFLNYVSLLGVAGDIRPTVLECPVIPRWGTCPTVAWDMK